MNVQEIDFIPGHLKSIYIVCNLHRLGAATFLTRLEHEHYPPDTTKNDDFHVFHIFYNKLPYYVIEIPVKDYPIIVSLADQCGFKPVQGKPQSMGDEEKFNLQCPDFSCFTLENKDPTEHDALSEAYKAQLNAEYIGLKRS
jgi:hypothetical protein